MNKEFAGKWIVGDVLGMVDDWTDYELYEPLDGSTSFHTDKCNLVFDDDRMSDEVVLDNSNSPIYEVMGEEDYNNTILANTCEYADYGEWYDDKDALVLCIMVRR